MACDNRFPGSKRIDLEDRIPTHLQYIYLYIYVYTCQLVSAVTLATSVPTSFRPHTHRTNATAGVAWLVNVIVVS